MNQLVRRHSNWGGDLCDGGSQTCIGTTRHLIGCQKQYRQNELAGGVEVPTWVDGPGDGRSQTHVGTTDVFPPVKKNTDRMNQLVR